MVWSSYRLFKTINNTNSFNMVQSTCYYEKLSKHIAFCTPKMITFVWNSSPTLHFMLLQLPNLKSVVSETPRMTKQLQLHMTCWEAVFASTYHRWHNHNTNCSYGTAQLQGNVCTCPRLVLHSFQMCLAHILDASYTRFRCILHAFWMHLSGKKGRGAHIRLAAALSRDFALARICLVHVLDTSRTHPRCALHAFQTCADIILELSCTAFFEA